MTTSRIRISWASLAVVSVLASSAVIAQTKIKQGFNLFSVEQDQQIGRQSAQQVEQQMPMLNDASIEGYVRAVGDRLAGAMPQSPFSYRFKVVNASDVNAFALPGGYMYVNRGLLESVKTEGQLAGVLAHEMAHVALRHGTNQASKAYLGQTGLGILGGFLSKNDGSSDDVVNAVGGFGLNALFLKFSRTDEEQADVFGAQTMARAGYDPQEMADFFDVLRGLQSRSPSKVEQFFSSHPTPQNRAARIRNERSLLTIKPTSPIGGLQQAKTRLASMPAARTTQQIAQNPPSTTTSRRTVGGVTIEAPASSYNAFTSRSGLYRIEFPSNWRAYESSDGVGVTIAPEGGLVDAGGRVNDLVYGVVVNHYAPFNSDTDPNGRFSPLSFQGAPGISGSRDLSRSQLASATNDLIGEIARSNNTLRLVADSQRTDVIDGAPALSVVLSGRSPATGEDERVTVFTRELPDEHIVYALFIAPGQDYSQLRSTFSKMISSLRVNDSTSH